MFDFKSLFQKEDDEKVVLTNGQINRLRHLNKVKLKNRADNKRASHQRRMQRNPR